MARLQHFLARSRAVCGVHYEILLQPLNFRILYRKCKGLSIAADALTVLYFTSNLVILCSIVKGGICGHICPGVNLQLVYIKTVIEEIEVICFQCYGQFRYLVSTPACTGISAPCRIEGTYLRVKSRQPDIGRIIWHMLDLRLIANSNLAIFRCNTLRQAQIISVILRAEHNAIHTACVR